MRKLWELLVPTVRNDGRPIRRRCHREWDRQIHRISGGLTVMNPVKGQWISPDATLFRERMIPVRIIASDEEMNKILKLTMKFYEQEALLTYVLSNEVRLVNKDEV